MPTKATSSRGRRDGTPRDDPTERLYRPFRRVAMPFNVIFLLFGVGMAAASFLQADRVGALLLGGLLWLGGSSVAATSIVRRVRGKERPRVPPGLQDAELEEAKHQALGLMWKQLRATALFLLALTATYGLIAGVDAARREALLISALVVASLAVLAALGSIGVRRRYVKN